MGTEAAKSYKGFPDFCVTKHKKIFWRIIDTINLPVSIPAHEIDLAVTQNYDIH